MSRNYIHDIRPSSRTVKRRSAHERRVHELEESFTPEPPRYARGSGSGRGVWYVAALAIIVLVFALTFVFAGATVYVTPRTGTVELSGPISAEKEARTGLSFEVLSLSDDASATISAGEKQYVEKKATGTVRLFNDNGTASQNLLIDTRLESADGHIYKTKKAITIPGQKIVNGKTTPGSVDVEIYADEAGDSYNLSQGDFKIVGFRGSPKYETLYARSITSIAGGFKGETYSVSDDELEAQKTALKNKLKTTLLEKARAQLPKDFIMYDDTAFVSFDEPIITDSGTAGSAKIVEKGKLSAPIFKESELTNALTSRVISNTEENKVLIPNIRDLNITLDQSASTTDPATLQSIKIIISDKINVVWQIDKDEVKKVLLGVRKRDFESKMIAFKNIDKAELNLKPFWKTTIPEKSGSIKVINTLAQGSAI